MSPFGFSAMSGAADGAAPADEIMERMAAGAFGALCDHLRDRSDGVQNIDLMTVGGFCRNCLAKWMVLEARKLSKQLSADKGFASNFVGTEEECKSTTDALNSFGYDEAAKEVYGATYPEWKKRHQKKATDEQLRLYKDSSHLHATHDAGVLKTVDGITAQTVLPGRVMVRLQAGAFLSLCHHLRARSDEVQNMELMTIGGFCRNCLAKWLVLEARKISEQIGADGVAASYFPEQRTKTINSLDSFGYDEGARYVYGCTLPDWKKRHQKKATDEQMKRYNSSKGLHARHDKGLLATRSSSDVAALQSSGSEHRQAAQMSINGPTQQSSLLSDVCCQDVDNIVPSAGPAASKNSSYKMPRPPRGDLELKVGILTVSDRAAANAYVSGDLSGPAVERSILTQTGRINDAFEDRSVKVTLIKRTVADEIADIKEVLMSWSGKTAAMNGPCNLVFMKEALTSWSGKTAAMNGPCDLVFTTGGTGFSKRDVTPEATLSVLDGDCQGLMSWASAELAARQPLAALSRAAAGTCGDTLIVNLPGNPAGAAEVVEFLFPLLLHAVKDLRGDC